MPRQGQCRFMKMSWETYSGQGIEGCANPRFHARTGRADLYAVASWFGANVIKVERPGAGTMRARRHAGQRTELVPREAERPAAARSHRRTEGISAAPEGYFRSRGATRGQCVGRRPAGAGAI